MSVTRHVLSDGDVSVAILNIGCTLQDWRVPMGDRRVPVVLGFADPQDYVGSQGYLGAIVGRVANRISGAQFDLNGETFRLPANEPPNHLHGGPEGVHTRIWDMEPDGDTAVRLTLTSPHMDQGYPGRLDVSVTITLSGFDLTYDIRARSDRPSPVNLAQHAYYNLMGSGPVSAHMLSIAADRTTPTDTHLIPTGATTDVTGTDADFRQPRPVGTTPRDLNYVLTGPAPAARLHAPNGLSMTLWSDQPCLQLYTAHALQATAPALAGQTHGPFAGICLEAQQYPNAINTPDFPLTLITPDQPYRQALRLRIAPKGAS